MSESHQMVELLEVFHARKLRSSLIGEIRRLRDDENFLPGSDAIRRQEVSAFYEMMLLTCTQLLQYVGETDRVPRDS